MKKRVRIHLVEERKRRQWSQQEVADHLGITRLTVSRWEQGQSTPGSYLRAKLCALFGKRPADLDLLDEQSPDESQQAPLSTTETSASSLTGRRLPIWHVPYSRNPFFTGREEVLSRLYESLHSNHATFAQSYVLTGLGGIGKTQTAIEYAYRYAQDYTAVLWISAETSDTLLGGFLALADLLDLPGRQEPEHNRLAVLVVRWLNSHDGWLLIFDNVEDVDILQRFLPGSHNGYLLFTTRSPALALASHAQRLETLSAEEGATLLLHRINSSRYSISDPRHALTISSHTKQKALEVVELLGGLPLALDQAGAYICETGCTIEDYVQRYRDQRRHILARRGIHTGIHPDSVTTTLLLAVERAEQKHPAAAELLRICALLHPEAIPEELFVAKTSEPESPLSPLLADPYQFDLALAALRDASLITRHAETRTISVHRLVQAVLQDQMEQAERQRRNNQVVRLIHAVFPNGEFGTWARCERVLAQALACVALIEKTGSVLPEAGELLYRVGRYLMERGRYEEAEPLLEQAILLEEHQHGSDRSLLVLCLLKKGELLWWQGRYSAAEELFRQTLALGEQHLGAAHLLVAQTFNDLAALCHSQGKYEQAEPLYQRSLLIREQQAGPEYSQTALTLNNLALLYRDQGKISQAKAFYERALHILERQLGPDHPETAIILSNLALLYLDQGVYEQAEPLYQRALRIHERQLGPDHPRVAECLARLATLYTDQARYELAEHLLQKALRIQNQALGDEHPEIAFSLHSLADLTEKQGKEEQAMLLLRRALPIFEQRLGQEHPETRKARAFYHRLLAQKRQPIKDAIEIQPSSRQTKSG